MEGGQAVWSISFRSKPASRTLRQGSMLGQGHPKSGLGSSEVCAKMSLTDQHSASFIEKVLVSKKKKKVGLVCSVTHLSSYVWGMSLDSPLTDIEDAEVKKNTQTVSLPLGKRDEQRHN